MRQEDPSRAVQSEAHHAHIERHERSLLGSESKAELPDRRATPRELVNRTGIGAVAIAEVIVAGKHRTRAAGHLVMRIAKEVLQPAVPEDDSVVVVDHENRIVRQSQSVEDGQHLFLAAINGGHRSGRLVRTNHGWWCIVAGERTTSHDERHRAL